MSKIKCIVTIVIAIAMQFIPSIILVSLPQHLQENQGIPLLVLALAVLAEVLLMIAVKQKHRLAFSVKSFGQGLLYGAPMLAVSIGFFIKNFHQGMVDFGGITVSAVQVIFTCLFLLMGAGIGEELLSRGVIMSSIRATGNDSRKATIAGVVISAVIFGLMHLGNIVETGDVVGTLGQVVYAAGIGIYLGAIFVRSGNIWANALLHFLFDLSVMTYTSFFSQTEMTVADFLGDHMILKSIIIGIVSAAAGFFLLRKDACKLPE